jgi:hypothetical protein
MMDTISTLLTSDLDELRRLIDRRSDSSNDSLDDSEVDQVIGHMGSGTLESKLDVFYPWLMCNDYANGEIDTEIQNRKREVDISLPSKTESVVLQTPMTVKQRLAQVMSKAEANECELAEEVGVELGLDREDDAIKPKDEDDIEQAAAAAADCDQPPSIPSTPLKAVIPSTPLPSSVQSTPVPSADTSSPLLSMKKRLAKVMKLKNDKSVAEITDGAVEEPKDKAGTDEVVKSPSDDMDELQQHVDEEPAATVVTAPATALKASSVPSTPSKTESVVLQTLMTVKQRLAQEMKKVEANECELVEEEGVKLGLYCEDDAIKPKDEDDIEQAAAADSDQPPSIPSTPLKAVIPSTPLPSSAQSTPFQ